MTKIEILNALDITDWSCCGGECEYVLAENTDENKTKLIAAGFTEDDLKEAVGDDETDIDLSYLAFNCTTAKWWSKKDGFSDGM